uniref:Uncharacterized protein n=1 Tax=Anguilla anguilla TaxID=7936 RepID=A0A0E9V9J8_ANGAN
MISLSYSYDLSYSYALSLIQL